MKFGYKNQEALYWETINRADFCGYACTCKFKIDCRPLYVRFVEEKVTLGQVSHQVLKFSCTIIIPSMYHIQLHKHAALTRNQICYTR